MEREILNVADYRFRGLHPKVYMGAASDRYGGWLGQIYTPELYQGKTSTRKKYLGKKAFEEIILPIESAAEYFQHFRTLEIDFTFYRYLLDPDGSPSPNYHLLRSYREYLAAGDLLLLKVPQAVFAPQKYSGKSVRANPDYLNPDVFTKQFYEPAVAILGDCISGFIFEQEYQRRNERVPPLQLVDTMDNFFSRLPGDSRYHVELRTDALLTKDYFSMLKAHGVGQVLSHWTWLPPLRKQFERADRRFFNAGKRIIIRLLTPLGVKYDDSYGRAHPFDKMVEGMMDPVMVKEAAALMLDALIKDLDIFVIGNNRAGGNAPGVLRAVSEEFLALKDSYEVL